MRKGQITVDHDHELRLAAEAVLKTVTRIKGQIKDEPDAATRRRLRRLLSKMLRKVRAYHESVRGTDCRRDGKERCEGSK